MRRDKVIKRYSNKWLDHKSFVEDDGKFVLRSARQLMTVEDKSEEIINETLTETKEEIIDNENFRED